MCALDVTLKPMKRALANSYWITRALIAFHSQFSTLDMPVLCDLFLGGADNMTNNGDDSHYFRDTDWTLTSAYGLRK